MRSRILAYPLIVLLAFSFLGFFSFESPYIPAAHATPTNYVANPGLETGDFTGWSIQGQNESISSGEHYSGSYSALLGIYPGQGGIMWQEVNQYWDSFIYPTAIRNFTVWVKSVHVSGDEPYDFKIEIAYNDDFGTPETWIYPVIASGSWILIDLKPYLNVSAQHIDAIYVMNDPSNTGVENSLYVDDFSLILYDNFYENTGHFESGLSGWEYSGAVSQSNDYSYRGTYSAKMGYSSILQKYFIPGLATNDLHQWGAWLLKEHFQGAEPYSFKIIARYSDLTSTTITLSLVNNVWTFIDIFSYITPGKILDRLQFSNYMDLWSYVYVDQVTLFYEALIPTTSDLGSITLVSPAHLTTLHYKDDVYLRFTPVWTISNYSICNATVYINGTWESQILYPSLVNNTVNYVEFWFSSWGTYTWYVRLYNSTAYIQSATWTLTLSASLMYLTVGTSPYGTTNVTGTTGYAYGTIVPILATPLNSSCDFKYWKILNKAYTTNPITVLMDQNRTINPTFSFVSPRVFNLMSAMWPIIALVSGIGISLVLIKVRRT